MTLVRQHTTNILQNKHSHAVTTWSKGILLVFVIASVSFVSLSAFCSQPPRWSSSTDCLLLRSSNQNIALPTNTPRFSPDSIAPTNLSHIVFGISGSVNTWTNRMHYAELWWRPNATRGYVWLDQEPDPKLFSHPNSPPYKVSDSRTGLTQSPAARISRIVVESFKVGLPDVRWFVMGDDDTVFFADNLVSVLSKYDHRQMYYVGGNSESVEQDVMHSYGMAFGGGGFAVSYRLAAELAKVFDGCLDRYHYFYGSDQRVWACVSELGVSLTGELGFHQMDVRGDAYGILAAHPMAPLVSLHHLDYVKPLLPNQTKFESLENIMQAYRLDPSRTMQQSFCYYNTWWHKWSISVSWGYTVQIYPSLVPASELEMPLQTFLTWRSFKDGPFTFNTRRVATNPCEQPSIYFLDQVQDFGNETATIYKRHEMGKQCSKGYYPRGMETIVVSALKMNPNYWLQGLKRQCCDISNWKYGGMEVRIRNCKDGETISG